MQVFFLPFVKAKENPKTKKKKKKEYGKAVWEGRF